MTHSVILHDEASRDGALEDQAQSLKLNFRRLYFQSKRGRSGFQPSLFIPSKFTVECERPHYFQGLAPRSKETKAPAPHHAAFCTKRSRRERQFILFWSRSFALAQRFWHLAALNSSYMRHAR
jgi:hypothetical protein